ncbi:AraC family transcriptional regulator (plasmid) [Azospirillum brasilense]|uniref:AraC family transcriptional regulator n=1 Tax=Azospirillum brasilense TaxID=192 RepID=A0A4D8QPB9_AZOBR|nr:MULTISPECIES: AraC family transcriptional regulator [Azospirillum]MDW7556700.1 AraC family transcriptional regulator [Azospirillum brasilense]MDW7596971.1 AraC family transcriptional regulator [Azospirillum brasilense]MDW7631374.1 AraC family transcriptional regulator [Azospirillum brasilense]MDX5949848.1 AraC family transcriptional regulator [Azospirillum brasilense]QCO12745.1 AraC family transcriptional regulator [Azospirillum brasilense]
MDCLCETGQDVFQVDPSLLARLAGPGSGWRDHALPCRDGSMHFRIGRIGPGISLTRSDCRLRGDYRSRIDHGGAVGVLAFGLSGISLFGCGDAAPRHTVRAGDVWLFRLDDAPITRVTPAQERAGMLAVKFDLDRVGEALAGAGLDRMPGGTRAVRLGRSEAGTNRLRPLLDNGLTSPLDRLMAESATLGMLAHWLAPLSNDGSLTDRAMGEGVLDDGERRGLAWVADLLLSDLCHPPSLDRLAETAGMSHARLNRCFRKAYGQTVFAWLRDRRLERAEHCLRSGGQSVTEIAFLCGFSSSSHFASAFRERHGCSPAEFRRRC